MTPSASDSLAWDRPCAGPTSVPILHLHLLQRCNLSCAHCYSVSSPTAEAALSRDEALGAVHLAGRLGYTHVALSGGEPLLSPHLPSVLSCAKASGLHVSIVTNGLQATTPANLKLLARADGVSVSLDGLAATHDALRRRAGSFQTAVRALTAMSAAGIPCGASCGVSPESLDEVEEMTAVVLGTGAGFLNFHAIEATGRAADLPDDRLLTRDEHTLLYLASHALAHAVAGRMAVHCDLLHKDRVIESPAWLYSQPPASGPDDTDVARRLGVLVVEPNGTLSPVCYGFDRRRSLGTLQRAIETGGESVRAAAPAVLQSLQKAGTALQAALADDDDWVVLNPSEELARVALRQ